MSRRRGFSMPMVLALSFVAFVGAKPLQASTMGYTGYAGYTFLELHPVGSGIGANSFIPNIILLQGGSFEYSFVNPSWECPSGTVTYLSGAPQGVQFSCWLDYDQKTRLRISASLNAEPGTYGVQLKSEQWFGNETPTFSYTERTSKEYANPFELTILLGDSKSLRITAEPVHGGHENVFYFLTHQNLGDCSTNVFPPSDWFESQGIYLPPDGAEPAEVQNLLHRWHVASLHCNPDGRGYINPMHPSMFSSLTAGWPYPGSYIAYINYYHPPSDSYVKSSGFPLEIPARAPSICTSRQLPKGILNEAYRNLGFSDCAGNAKGSPATWMVIAGALPEGLTLSSDGFLSGTPTRAGLAEFRVMATNPYGSDTADFKLLVEGPEAECQPPKINGTGELPKGTVGKEYHGVITASGDSPIEWSVTSPFLPPWLELKEDEKSDNLLLSGVPEERELYVFSLSAKNDCGIDYLAFFIEVDGGGTAPEVLPTFPDGRLPDATVGVLYNQMVMTILSGADPISLPALGLPAGMEISDKANVVFLTGIPQQPGLHLFSVTASNLYGFSPPAFYQIYVRPSGNTVRVGAVELPYKVDDNGVAVLGWSEALKEALVKWFGTKYVLDFTGQMAVNIYIDASLKWLKDTNKTLTIITDGGAFDVKTQSLWNNSGQMRLITIQNNNIHFKNVPAVGF